MAAKDAAKTLKSYDLVALTSDQVTERSKSPTPYFKLQVGTPRRGYQFCYQGTEQTTMLFRPQIPDGNLSLVWVVKPSKDSTSITISNYVTDLANQSPLGVKTYLNLGTKVSSSPEIYFTILKGDEQKFYIEPDSSRTNFAIFTYNDDEKAYLIPSTDVGSDNIVAMIKPEKVKAGKELYVFRIFPSEPPFLPM